MDTKKLITIVVWVTIALVGYEAIKTLLTATAVNSAEAALGAPVTGSGASTGSAIGALFSGVAPVIGSILTDGGTDAAADATEAFFSF